jgi:hypothetical protein
MCLSYGRSPTNLHTFRRTFACLLRKAGVDTYVHSSEYDVDSCFVPHLVAEYPEIKATGFEEFFVQESLKLINILKLLLRRKTYKGTCPICMDW